MAISPTVTLNNGVTIPRIGLGVYQSPPGQETRDAVLWALEAGYRHIDTAAVYVNEADVGAAIRESGIPRREIFVTTKLWNSDQGYDSALRAGEASLARLGMEYVDLYLIHWPEPRRRLKSWRALEKLHADKRCRAIGVSNFLPRHLDELLASATVVPAVNQVELHPFLFQKELLGYCAEKGIKVEAYSPLTRGARLDHPAVAKIALKHKVSPARIFIRWALEQDTIVLPKSVTRERIVENHDVYSFSLDASDRAVLDALNENLHTCWDPNGVA